MAHKEITMKILMSTSETASKSAKFSAKPQKYSIRRHTDLRQGFSKSLPYFSKSLPYLCVILQWLCRVLQWLCRVLQYSLRNLP